MPTVVKKYNPSFQSDDDVVASFCVRQAELESLLQSLRASTGASNVHSLVIGPRGSGKTHLLLRVAAEIRRESHLSSFYPIVFAEESYEVSTAGEFWLECLGHLAEQAPEEERANLRLTYGDLRTTPDDYDLGNRCLGAIRDFADRLGKRLVLLVENLNMLFADMTDPEAGWRLRHTLQNEPQIVLFGSATSRFDEIDHPDHAFYDLFRTVTLRPLDTQSCETMWEAISGKRINTQKGRETRPLEILTGGNPRLLAIIARFSAGLSFEELMNSLLDLVDDHTDYFKSHIESLPHQERRIYLALARLWKPASAKEVAEQARAETSACSSLLRRLVDRGDVSIVGGTRRRRQYYITERLYNIYYLLRRGGGESRVVEALIHFMISLYSSADLWDAFRGMLLGDTPETSSLPSSIGEYLAKSMLEEATAFAKAGEVDKALEMHDDIVKRWDADVGVEPPVVLGAALLAKIPLLFSADREGEVIKICNEVVNRFQSSTIPEAAALLSVALVTKTVLLIGARRISEAVDAAKQASYHSSNVSQDLKPIIESSALLAKALAFYADKNVSEANAIVENIVSRTELPFEDNFAKIMTATLSLKGSIYNQTLSDREALILLSCISQLDGVSPSSIEALTRFIATAGPARALDLIKASGTSELLLPLETALLQELGQETNVAVEVDEVAKDVRVKLEEIKFDFHVSEPSVSVTKPESTERRRYCRSDQG